MDEMLPSDAGPPADWPLVGKRPRGTDTRSSVQLGRQDVQPVVLRLSYDRQNACR